MRIKNLVKILRLSVILLLSASFTDASAACAASLPDAPSFDALDSLYSDYSFIIFLDDPQGVPTLSDDEFYEKSAKVIFRVNRTELNLQSEFIKELTEKVIPRINADSLQLYYMLVKGAASPEGPYANNVRLGKGRCAELFKYINSHLAFPAPEGSYNLDFVAEDYENLCRLMREANDPMTDVIQDLVTKYTKLNNYPDLKYILQHMNKGTVWPRLLREYFPKLRSARVMLFFRKYKPEAPISSVILPKSVYSDTMALTTLPSITPIEIQPVPFELRPVEFEPTRLVRKHALALRTNLLYDFFYMPGHYWAPSPNIQVEFYPKFGHFTANFSFTCPYWHRWDKHEFWQIRDYMFECRYYFKGKARFIGPYVSAYVHTNIYGIGFDEKEGYEGEGLGGGALLGWVFNISKNRRWRLELSLGVGYYETKYDPYVYGNPVSKVNDGLYYYDYLDKAEDFKKRNHRFRWIGPTNVGIHITYDLLYYRIKKRGISFNRTEKGGVR